MKFRVINIKFWFVSIGLVLSVNLLAQRNTLHDLDGIVRLQYNNPGLQVDLGVGLWAWPIPIDFDKDGDMDLVVSSSGNFPYNGLYYYENLSGDKFPVFKKSVRWADGPSNIQISYINNEARILGPGFEYSNFRNKLLNEPVGLMMADDVFKLVKQKRLSEWRLVDYENDGDLDLIVGIDDWSEYGWDNAFDSTGKWKNGPLHGYVILVENDNGTYRVKGKINAGGKPIDQFGQPTPNMYDFDGDGDLDLICGEFLDKLTWYENIGTREKPEFAAGRILTNDLGPVKMHLEMIMPVAADWDSDGDIDLIVGDEDGRVALIENTGAVNDHQPLFKAPVYFRQEADFVKFGALVSPCSVDWDDDGDEDLICGDSAGNIGYIENLGGFPPRWNEPVLLQAEGKPIRIMAGENGSIQGPVEQKWGYTTLSVADWDGDGLKDIVVNSIWGKVEWFKNIGTRIQPKLAAKQTVKIDYQGKRPLKPVWNWWIPAKDELATQWRTTPYVTDWNKDGLMDLVMLDQEGYLAFFKRVKKSGQLVLLPGERIFVDADKNNLPLRLNEKTAGGSGRRKFCLADWDGDGDTDLMIDSQNICWYENIGSTNGKVVFKKRNDLMNVRMAGHDTSPTIVDWNKDGVPDLLFGAEDGHLYYFQNKRK